MKQFKKRAVALVLTLALLLTLAPVALAEETFSDMPTGWSRPAMEAAVANGLLKGDNGKLNPTGNLKRAEMAAFVARAFGAENTASLAGFTDVVEGAWYCTELSQAVQMGIVKGDKDKIRPNDYITRQEVFTALARAMKLEDGTAADLAAYPDAGAVASWAVPTVAAMVKAGYVTGSSGKLNPASNITRQEFAQLMYNLFSHYVKEPGVVTELPKGNVLINTPDVTVKGVTIHGDVIIGDGVGDGDVTFENVTIEGSVLVRGGGVNSIHFINSRTAKVIVSKVLGAVRVVADKASAVKEVAVVEGQKEVVLEGSVQKLAVESTTPVKVQNATVSTLEITTANAKVALTGTTTVTSLGVEAVNVTITTEAKVTINTVKAEKNVTIEGDGKVQKIEGDGKVTDEKGEEVTPTPSTPSTPSTPTTPTNPDPGEKDPEITTPEITQPTPSDPTTEKPTDPTIGAATEGNVLCGSEGAEAETHTWGTATKGKDPTCKEFGTQTYTCATCGAIKTEYIAKVDHTKGAAEVEEAGNCVTKAVMVKKCTTTGCNEVLERYAGEVDTTKHKTLVTDKAVPATCTEAGKEAGEHCSACNTVTKEQKAVSALGHDMKAVENSGKEATCTEDGKEADKKCSRCEEKTTGAVIKATGHTEVAIDPVPPTCGKDGSKDGIKCSVCNTIIKEPVTDPATGSHTYGEDGKAAACTVCGKSNPDYKEPETP